MLSKKKVLKNPQRALILGGGGAVGAYQAGVLKVLCKRLIEEDNRRGNNSNYDDHHDNGKPLLFDIIAGTSIGAMNGAVLLSQYLKTGSWETAAEQLEQFWTNKEKGLASTVSEQDFQSLEDWKKWHNESNKHTSGVASAEAARRYYSAKHYFFRGAPKVQEILKDPRTDDSRFFDNQLNRWFIHSPDRLENTILNFAERKIATRYENNQPRFLIFSVDVAESKTVTFDSYPKSDDPRKVESDKYNTETRGGPYDDVTKYNNDNDHDGVSIYHVMASGTLPEFYDYKEIGGRKFCDGGLLSNTPFRELLQAHQEYWMHRMSHTRKTNNIPDLEVYVVNLHPAKRKVLPTDHDGVRDRVNDIIYGDRSSHHDEKMAYLVADLRDFAAHMKKLSSEAISIVGKESEKKKLKKKFHDILATKTTPARKGFDDDGKSASTYSALLKGQYNLTKVVRIERAERDDDPNFYADSIFGKSGDFTAETIHRLIEDGKRDAADASLLR